jgi:tetratricopeptide (TPR) repeat protein
MAKIALVIGVSDYEPGLNPLPGATRDVEAMRRVLQHPEVGGFDEVKTLSNPEPQKMQEAIETLFSGRMKDDLVLLFFSGHGVKDDNGKLYLATRVTRKTTQGELIRATAVPASFVQDIMSNSRSKRQVVILDCCFSGAFAEGWLAKDDGSVDVKSQLGGEGRAVLTSSTSTQYSFEQEGSDLSTYTRYLVEGIETGAADLDSDGVVSIDELHRYAKGKVQEAAPAMRPEIYAVKEGYSIHLSQAPTEDPKLRYRKEVEHCASRGEISALGRYTLDELRLGLKLPLEDAAAIEDEVLKPFQERQKKKQRYEQFLVETIQREGSLSSDTQNELKRLQRVLKLRDEDIAEIEAQMTSQKKAIQPSGNFSVPSVPSLRNPKLLVGSGIATIVALTFAVLGNIQQPGEKVSPTSTASPTVSTVSTAIPTVSSETAVNSEDLFKKGFEKSKQRDYEEAIKYYTKAIQTDKNWGANDDAVGYYGLATAYYNRGLAQYTLRNYQDAIADNSQAIKIKPDYASAYFNRGLAQYNLRNYQDAIADYSQAIKITPDDADAYYNRGLAQYTLRNYQDAIADYNLVLKLKPDDNAYYGRGLAKSKLGDKKGAISDYQKAAELYQKKGETKGYQNALEQLKKLQ